MKNINEYIEREQAFKGLDLYTAWLRSEDDQMFVEHILNGKTNGKTIWQDVGGGLKRLFSSIGILVGLGAKKFFNWITGNTEERKEKNNGIWPGFYNKYKEEIKHNEYKLTDINTLKCEGGKPEIEKILEDTDSSDENTKTGFGDFIEHLHKDIEELNLNTARITYAYTTYKKKEFLSLMAIHSAGIDNIEEGYLPILQFTFANDIVKYGHSLSKVFKIIKSDLQALRKKNYSGSSPSSLPMDKGLVFIFNKEIDEKMFGNLKFRKSNNIENTYYIDNEILEEGLNEDLDAENLMWKIDKWFEDRAQERQVFYEMIAKYNQTVDVKDLAKDIKDTKFEETLKEFVNFMYDDFDFSTEKDYLYQLKKIIEYIKGKKVDLN